MNFIKKNKLRLVMLLQSLFPAVQNFARSRPLFLIIIVVRFRCIYFIDRTVERRKFILVWVFSKQCELSWVCILKVFLKFSSTFLLHVFVSHYLFSHDCAVSIVTWNCRSSTCNSVIRCLGSSFTCIWFSTVLFEYLRSVVFYIVLFSYLSRSNFSNMYHA